MQADQWQYLQRNSLLPLLKINFLYDPPNAENKAPLNFHLTNREKYNIEKEIMSKENKKSFAEIAKQ
jgi:hypothetical protein